VPRPLRRWEQKKNKKRKPGEVQPHLPGGKGGNKSRNTMGLGTKPTAEKKTKKKKASGR